jgi:hypothetical protein
MLVGIVALLVGTVPGGFGMPPWLSIVLGIVILASILKLLGKKAEVA